MEYALFIALAVLLVWLFTEARKEGSISNHVEVDDETLYDPESGKEFTIDEADHIVLQDNKNRLLSDEELEKYYNEDYHEKEYIRRHLLQKQIPEIDSQSFYPVIEKTQFIRHYTRYVLNFSEIKPGLFFGLIGVSFSEGSHRNEFEWQLVLIIDLGIPELQQLPIPELDNYIFETVDHYLVIKGRKKARLAEAEEILEWFK